MTPEIVGLGESYVQDANTVDHVLSVKSHPDMAMSQENLVSCCKRCNSMKGARSEAVFLARKFTPPAFPTSLSPRQSSTVPSGPCVGQSRQD
jgi:5-methylcytosine-specific restriction endonuclease McrA